MEIDSLEQAVQTIIYKVYKAEYNKKITITELKYINVLIYGYHLILILNREERPLDIMVEGNEDYFLESVEKELIERRLIDTKFYLGEKLKH